MKLYIKHLKVCLCVIGSCYAANLFSQSTLELRLAPGHHIDSISMFNLGQTIFVGEKVSAVTTIKYESQYPDIFNLQFHSKAGILQSQLWLDPGQLRIDANVSGKEVIIDSVYNSPTFVLSQRFRKDYSQHLKDTSDHSLFLSHWYDNVKSSAFSIEIAKTIIYWNKNNKPVLIELLSSLRNSPPEVTQNVLFESTMSQITGLIGSDKIDLSSYTFLDQSGVKTRLEFGKEKITVIDFWFTACPPCIEQHRSLVQVLPELRKNNVRVVGLSTDMSIEKWKTYLKKHPDQNWMQLHTGDGSMKNVQTDLGIISFPTYLIVNSAGDIIKFHGSLDEVLQDLGVR